MPKEYRGSAYIPELMVTANKYANGKDDTIDGGILPEIVAIPDNVELVTQYPLKGFTGTKFIGHSSLVSPATEFYNAGPFAGAGKNFINITKRMEDPDYDLIKNNCSNATRDALEQISGKSINPFLFTTPGDVKDFAESELGGVTKYEGGGRYRTYIPISKNDRKVLHDLSRKRKKTSFNYGKEELPYPLRTSADYDDNLAYQRGILRDPKTGHMWSTTQEEYPKERIYLKKPNHPTYSKAIWGDMTGGYDVYRKGDRDYAAPTFSELMYTKPPFRYDSGKDSGIHINPKNRGKFNALKKRTGKTTEQLTHSKNPLTRKRAIFAQNSKKFKH